MTDNTDLTKKKRKTRSIFNNPEIMRSLIECFEMGLNIVQSCEASGISVSTYKNNMDREPEFKRLMVEAQTKYRNDCRKRVLSRMRNANAIVDSLLGQNLKSTKITTRKNGDGDVLDETKVEEVVLPDRWLIERYLIKEIEDTTTEEIVVRVNFNDSAPIEQTTNTDDDDELTFYLDEE
jgi:hypothetical protein